MTKASILVTDGDGDIGSEVISQLSLKEMMFGLYGVYISIGKKRIST